MAAKNKPLYLAVKRNVDFLGLKKELKNTLYEDFHIIVQIPRKLPSDLWVDDELNNEEDTELGKEETHQLQIPIRVHAIQYLGEEIIPYTGEEEQEQ